MNLTEAIREASQGATVTYWRDRYDWLRQDFREADAMLKQLAVPGLTINMCHGCEEILFSSGGRIRFRLTRKDGYERADGTG